MSVYAGQPQKESVREGFEFIDRSSGNADVRTASRSFYTVSPVLDANAEGEGKLQLAETENPIPEPFGAILVPPIVGRRRHI
jgi:hypothetical protein